MLNTLKIFNELKQTMDPAAAEKIVDVIGSIYDELKNSVTKSEFNELKVVVGELAEAQKKTEFRLGKLTERVEELAEAQKRTETRVEELVEAQKRTEIRLEELAEAQKRTEARVDELAEAQKRTEIRMEELAEAQKVTEVKLAQLTVRMDELTANVSRLELKVEDLVGEMKQVKIDVKSMRQEIGGISHAVGYGLEDSSYLKLPPVLKRDHSIVMKGPLKRGFLEAGPNKYIEINIWGHGERDGKSIEIVGEAKTQLKKRDIDKFLQTLKALEPHISRTIFPLCVTYHTSPAIEQYSKDKGINLYFTYELQSL
ncbi:MAG: hypothetical protein ACP5U1_05005 [Desulfomonilaceae bacterium]